MAPVLVENLALADITTALPGVKPLCGLYRARSAYKTKAIRRVPRCRFERLRLASDCSLSFNPSSPEPRSTSPQFHLTMATAFNFTRRRFLALASAVPALLILARCAPIHRPDGYDDNTYDGPFFTDGSNFFE
jgi:hypothetical protein